MRRLRVIYITLCAALLACLLLGGVQQRYRHSALGVHLGREDVPANLGSIVALPGQQPAGRFTKEPQLTLASGRYKAIVRYGANEAGSMAFVWLQNVAGSQNGVGAVLASAELSPERSEAVLNFTLTKSSSTVRLLTDYSGKGTLTLHSINILSQKLAYTDALWLCLAIALLAAYFYKVLLARPLAPGQSLAGRLRAQAPLLLVLGLGLLASFPMFFNFIPKGHDIDFHFSRIEGIARGLQSGQFPVRINPVAGGKGYANGLLYPDIFLYPFALLRLCGVSQVGAWQALHIAINLSTAGVMFYSARRLLKNRWAAAFAAMVYSFAAYRFTDLYLRAALGESLGMIFFPLAVLGLYRVFFGNAKKWWQLALAFAGIVLSHMLSAVIALLFAGVFALAFARRLWRDKTRLAALAKAAALCLGLCLWFVGPMLYMVTQNLVLHTMNYNLYNSALYLPQLLMQPVLNGEMGDAYLPGMAVMACALLCLAALAFTRRQRRAKRLENVAKVALVFAMLALFVSTRLFPWQTLKSLSPTYGLLNFIQFPWRFVAVASVLLSFCGGVLAAWFLPGRHRAVLFTAAILLCLLPLAGFTQQLALTRESIQKNEPYDVETQQSLATREYMYDGVNTEFIVNAPPTVTANGAEVAIDGLYKNGASLGFNYRAKAPATLQLPLVWYPGYTAWGANGQKLEMVQAANHLIALDVPAGTGRVALRYTGLWWFRVGDAASLAVALGALGWALRPRLAAAKRRWAAKGGGLA